MSQERNTTQESYRNTPLFYFAGLVLQQTPQRGNICAGSPHSSRAGHCTKHATVYWLYQMSHPQNARQQGERPYCCSSCLACCCCDSPHARSWNCCSTSRRAALLPRYSLHIHPELFMRIDHPCACLDASAPGF